MITAEQRHALDLAQDILDSLSPDIDNEGDADNDMKLHIVLQCFIEAMGEQP